MKASVLTAHFLATVLLLAATAGKAQAAGCTNASLSGAYGYLLPGSLTEQGSLVPYADMGGWTADGKGNISGSGTQSFAGTIQQGTGLSGTYIVNTDCTGSVSLTYGSIGSFHFNLVVLNNGARASLVQTDQGFAVVGAARQQQTNCVLGSINGSYAFTISGSFIDGNGNIDSYTDSGKMTFNGAGSVAVSDTASAIGQVTPNRSFSGTYTTHSNCTGALAYTDPTLGALNMNVAILDGGQELRFIDTDSGTIFAGSATALGNDAVDGTMAQVASGGGWQTTFTLSNTGTAAANVELSFFDNNGDPLSLPLTSLDSGTQTTTSTLSEAIAAGGTVVVVTNASSTANLAVGSAQLTSDGNVSGFAIFRYNPTAQEAVVPLETRSAAAYVLAFDNTNGLSTGLALANVSSQAVKVPLVVRDDSGAKLGTATINLAAHGHTSFTLTDKYGFARGKRGTVEFDTPPNGQISALGIRAEATGSFTSIPVLVK